MSPEFPRIRQVGTGTETVMLGEEGGFVEPVRKLVWGVSIATESYCAPSFFTPPLHHPRPETAGVQFERKATSSDCSQCRTKLDLESPRVERTDLT